MELNQLRYPFAEQAQPDLMVFVLNEKNKHTIGWTSRSRTNLATFGAVPMTKSETSPSPKYQRVQDICLRRSGKYVGPSPDLESETGLA